jgi:hypothetical protein
MMVQVLLSDFGARLDKLVFICTEIGNMSKALNWNSAKVIAAEGFLKEFTPREFIWSGISEDLSNPLDMSGTILTFRRISGNSPQKLMVRLQKLFRVSTRGGEAGAYDDFENLRIKIISSSLVRNEGKCIFTFIDEHQGHAEIEFEEPIKMLFTES